MGGSEALQVAVNNQQTDLPVAEEPLAEAIRSVLTSENVAVAEVSLAIVDSQTMRDLNARFLNHDYDTDVLSFLLESDDGPNGRSLEGEVIVSAAIAQAQAARFEWTPQSELTLYVVHGTLHLCGYDDQTPEDLAEMRDRERAVLADLGLQPRYDQD